MKDEFSSLPHDDREAAISFKHCRPFRRGSRQPSEAYSSVETEDTDATQQPQTSFCKR